MLFAGDHVLPHITPSIGFQPSITRLALRDYLGSLRLMLTLPDSRLLPAHGPVTRRTHERVNELLAHHETRLEQTLAAASAGPVSALAAARMIPWTRRLRKFDDLDPMNQILAVGETSAHLEVLVIRGQLVRDTSAGGRRLLPPPRHRRLRSRRRCPAAPLLILLHPERTVASRHVLPSPSALACLDRPCLYLAIVLCT